MQNINQNILIMGMPLAGKSTIGARLAKKIGCSHFDLDKLIEEELGSSVQDIFNNSGEEQFRLYEQEILRNHKSKENYIISIGGGAVNNLTGDIIDLYKYRIWLRASIKELSMRRKKMDISRPLLYNTNNIHETLAFLLSQREPYYIKHSSITIDTNSKPIDVIIEEIEVSIYE